MDNKKERLKKIYNLSLKGVGGRKGTGTGYP